MATAWSLVMGTTPTGRAGLSATRLCAAIALMALTALPVVAAGYSLPVSVPDRIGRAQIFAYGIKDRNDMVGKRDIIWGDSGTKVPGIYALHYMTVGRDTVREHDLEWYKANHPDWVVYRDDRTTVANEFKYTFGYYTPVDFANPEVRQYLWDAFVQPYVGAGRYEGICVDNVGATNVWHRAGVFKDGVWNQEYTGQAVDPTYAQGVADWIKWMATRVHEAGMSLTLNLYPTCHREGLDDEPGFRLIANEADTILDEHGFTRKGKPLVTDKLWLAYVSLWADLARTKGIIVDDKIAEDRSQATPAVINWALANYLMIKGDRTYVAWPMQYGAAEMNDFPELYLSIGRPLEDFRPVDQVYQRRFEKAIAVINPSSKTAADYGIPAGQWRDLQGAAQSGTVSLPPASGLVLVSE